jgi:uncharacterized membrane protein YkvA (DUF1232 family)
MTTLTGARAVARGFYVARRNVYASPQQRLGILAAIIRDARLVWRLMSDSRVSLMAKVAIPLMAGLYLLSPLDFLPDVAPILGQMDDLAVLALAVQLMIRLAPQDVVNQYRDQLAREGGAKPGSTAETVEGEYRVID